MDSRRWELGPPLPGLTGMRTYLAPALLAIAAAACGQTTAAVSSSSISGVVRVGPTCPASSQTHPCPLKPVSSERLHIFDSAGRLIKTATSDVQGRFRVGVPAGGYVVAPVNPGRRYLRTPSVHVNVSAGKVVRIRVVLDNGMR